MCAPINQHSPQRQQVLKSPSSPVIENESFRGHPVTIGISLASILSFLIYFVKMYSKGERSKKTTVTKVRTALVTNADTIFGMKAVEEMNKKGAIVYMMCKNRDRGIEARDELNNLGCDSARIVLKYVDMSDFDSVRKFANDFSFEIDHLDILLNNVGTMVNLSSVPQRGLQEKELGHFLLTELMIPLLNKSKDSHIIIFVNKSLCFSSNEGKIDDHVAPSKFEKALKANTVYVHELRGRLKAKSNSINVMNCGPSNLSLTLSTAVTGQSSFFASLVATFIEFSTVAAVEGFQAAAYLIFNKTIKYFSGKFRSFDKAINSEERKNLASKPNYDLYLQRLNL